MSESADDPGVWEVRLGIYATRKQAEEVKEQITRLLCPDPDHAPPCPVPWSVSMLHASDLEDPDSYAELVEQARIEGHS
ncbi:hypothetical protein AB0C51_11200 [Streptomyces pathocidini]|uniref:SPOR domain-containing protein n=1 Tax=Streptomyces pathocidini TaxID=1650571 RepID=A0ABW7UU55_9ACTN|nr:hypothetical protein [Streptomyces pathocidini]